VNKTSLKIAQEYLDFIKSIPRDTVVDLPYMWVQLSQILVLLAKDIQEIKGRGNRSELF
jgi:hypothetical protein